MSRNALHTEENFWPSVSDMFLTLFVIALALYSQSNHKRGSGDEYIEHLATREAAELVENLQLASPNDAVISAFDVASLLEEDTKGNKRTTLAGYVMDIAEKSEQRGYFRLGSYTEEELAAARRDYTKAIELAYKSCVDVNTEEMPPHAAEQLRIVGKAMLRSIRKKDKNLHPTPEQLEVALSEAKKQIREQAERIRRMHSEEEYHRMELKIAELERLLAKSVDLKQLRDEIASLQKRIQELVQENETLKKRNGSLVAENSELSGRLNEDTRRVVMNDVKAVLEKTGLLQDVQVEEDAGVIRIPASSAYFKSEKFEKKYLYCCRDNFMAQLSRALTTIAENDRQKHLIDNIVIECHADKTGDYLENEKLSSLRALTIWIELDNASSGRLKNFKNKSDLGLFSHAGFGSRVPMKRLFGEDEDSETYKRRCRRIDIRFNCAPRTGNDQPKK